MEIDYGRLLHTEIPNFDTVCEEKSDGYASAALILMAVEAWATDNGREPEAFAAGIVDRAEALATIIRSDP